MSVSVSHPGKHPSEHLRPVSQDRPQDTRACLVEHSENGPENNSDHPENNSDHPENNSENIIPIHKVMSGMVLHLRQCLVTNLDQKETGVN
ncbi:hypothetical protein [Paenibacillus senegalensis]|uniref:hypothetical protein n=1 Tax=Paenibacillus senegalensis TaxID=1465766 RepID=UPI0011DCDB5C|nr:hypothetical protein [Paenibacillus senegalensis]